MAITSAQQQSILKLVVGFFNGSPGSVYMSEFADHLNNGGTIATLAEALTQSSAFKSASFYPSFLTSNGFAVKFIDSLMGAGTTYVTQANKDLAVAFVEGQLNSGVSRATAMRAVIDALDAASSPTDANNAAFGTAAALFDNRVSVADYYTITKLGTATDVATLQATIATVTNSTTSVTTANAAIDSGSVGASGGGGGSLTLSLSTNSTDVIVGGTANDTINAAIGTLQGGESIDGGAGVDTFTVRDNAGTNAVGTIRNVEQINVISLGTGGATVDFTDTTGYTSLNVWGAGTTATLNSIASGLNLTIGVLSGYGGDLTIGYQDLGNTNDTLTLNVNNASGFGLIESSQAFEIINVIAAGSGVGITASVHCNLNTFGITGTANVTLELDREGSTAGMAVNASALGGNLTLTIHSRLGDDVFSAGEFVINAGTGADVINLAPAVSGMATLDSALRIDGGEGNDTLRVGSENTGQGFPSAVGFENVDVIANVASAGLNFSSLTGSLTNVRIWGTAGADTAFELRNMSAGITVQVISGFGQGTAVGADLSVGLVSETGTADAITFNVNSADGFRFHESARAIETINLQVAGVAYAASASDFGTATTTFNILGNQNVTMRLNSTSANTALTISSTGLTAGNLSLFVDAISGNQQLNVTLGSGNDTLTLGTGAFHANQTAVINAGEGASNLLSMWLDTAGTLAPSISNFETITLNVDHNSAQFDASGVSGNSTLNIRLGSNASASLNVSKLPDTVTALNIGLFSGNTTANASAGQTYGFVSTPADLTVNINPTNTGAGNSAVLGFIDINSAKTLTFNFNGSNNLTMGDLDASQATALTLNIGAGASGIDVTFSALSAGNAGTVTINATAGDIKIGTANFSTANTVTINQANGTGTYSGSVINTLTAPKGDLTINVAGAGNSSVTAGVIISTATVRDDVSITTNGGDVLIGDLHMMDSSIASSIAGGLNITLVANGSADSIIINSINVGTGGTANTGAHNLTFTISGSGDVTIGSAILATGAASNNTANVVNATGLFGTLVLGFSATQSANFTVSLGADVASANSVRLGNGNDTVNGGGSKDTIEGGAGQDTLRGGGGSDVFLFLASAGDDNADHTLSAQSDFIMDFASGDVILFSGIVQVTSLAGYTSLSGMGTTSAVSTATLVGQALVTASYLAIFQASGNTYVEVSVNSGAATDSAIITIVLDGLTGWTALSSVFNITVGASGLYIAYV